MGNLGGGSLGLAGWVETSWDGEFGSGLGHRRTMALVRLRLRLPKDTKEAAQGFPAKGIGAGN